MFFETWQRGNDDSDDCLTTREFIFLNEHFATKYDEIQEAVSKLAGLDDLLAGEICISLCVYACSKHSQDTLIYNIIILSCNNTCV